MGPGPGSAESLWQVSFPVRWLDLDRWTSGHAIHCDRWVEGVVVAVARWTLAFTRDSDLDRNAIARIGSQPRERPSLVTLGRIAA